MRLKLVLGYNGAPLHGWQAQTGLPTVQGHLADAFAAMGQGPLVPMGAGRTDAGVHAWGQVAHVDVPEPPLPLVRYLTGLNHFLPPTIRVVQVAQVTEAFDARRLATSRRYAYGLWPHRVLRPDFYGKLTPMPVSVDVARLAEALEHLPLGERDWSGFRDAECQSGTPMCNLLSRRMTVANDGVVWLHVAADHFLHHMVRNIVGTWLEIGLGKRAVDDLARVLDSGDRRQAGPTAIADGLYLAEVTYPSHAILAIEGTPWPEGFTA